MANTPTPAQQTAVAKVYYCTDDSAMGDAATLQTGGLDYPLFVANDDYEDLREHVAALQAENERLLKREVELVAALECEEALHVPYDDGVRTLRRHGWVSGEDTAQQFVARLRRAALTPRLDGEGR